MTPSDTPDEWMTMLVGHEESKRWLHVANNSHMFHDPIAQSSTSHGADTSTSHGADTSTHDEPDDIGDCPNLGVNTHCVQAQKHDTEGFDRIIWNLQKHGADVWTRIDEIAHASDMFCIGISCAIKQRYIGGVTISGNNIVGHASVGYAAMEILYHTSCACAKRMERAIIARIRDNTDIAYYCRNKSDGGEGMSGNAPIYFVYAAYTLLPPHKTPDFSRFEPSCGDT